MEKILNIQSPHKGEEYSPQLKALMEPIEQELYLYFKSKLDSVYQKMLDYARSRLNPTKSRSAITGMLSPNDVMFAMNLKPVINIGIQLVRGNVMDELKKLGVSTLDIESTTGVNFNLSPDDVRFAKMSQERRDYLGKALTETTINATQEIVENGIRNGLSYQEVADQLSTSLGFDGTRALKIARTEANWGLSQAQLVYSQSLGIGNYVIVTASDACEECLEAAGSTSSNRRGTIQYSVADNVLPIHPNCILGGQEIIASNISAKIISHYNGPIVRITTVKGSKLAITPNHLVLTRRGWVPAKSINKGDYLASASPDIQRMLSAYPNRKSVKSLVDNISISGNVVLGRVPSTAIDFNGDEVFTQNVNVILSTSKLGNYRKAMTGESIHNSSLIDRDVDVMVLNGDSPSTKPLIRGVSPEDCLMASSNLSNPLFTTSKTPLDNFGLRLIAELDSIGEQSPTNHAAINTKGFTKLVDADSSIVSFDEVLDVQNDSFHGDVYDLETEGNWYATNSIITHNCRCVPASVVPDEWLSIAKSKKPVQTVKKSSGSKLLHQIRIDTN